MDKNNLSVSIIIPTLNCAGMLRQCLTFIRKQDYPQSKIEIVVADGGSTDKTVDVARKFKAKIVKNKEIYADIGVSVGMEVAKGNLFMVIAADNHLEKADTIGKIVEVFKNRKIEAAFPSHASSKKDNLYTRYVNTFTDPFSHFVYGYGSNGRTFKKIYKTEEHNNIYDLYRFESSKERPLIAFAQGFTLRSGFKRKKGYEFDDLLPVVQMIKDKKKIAYVHSALVFHHTLKGARHFIAKQRWATKNYFTRKSYGVYNRRLWFSKAQRLRMKIWPFYVGLILPPIFYGVFMAIKDKQGMWLFHPVMCYLSFYASVTFILSYVISLFTFSKKTVS